ncbi:MAG: HDOD domain-containing protein, partial [Deltaproteobacteria bacterium]|nr:HDOD domain-containing protein [Deltaproteobacteria bacterium]
MEATIQEWIEKGKNLPVFSGTVVNILRLTNSPDSNISQIAEYIKRDISLTAAILRIANSPAFGLFNKVATIDHAIMFLGFKTVRNLAIGLAVLNIFPVNEKYFLSRVWQRSILTALAARELCAVAGKKEDAFTIGLLHDIGLLAFYVYDKNKALEILKKAENAGKMNLDDEKNYIGIDHVEAGRLLAERWKLPEEITLIMTHHHEEPQNDLFDPSDGNLFRVIYLASMAGDIFYLGHKSENIQRFKDGCQRLLGISAHDANQLLKDIHPRLLDVAKCLNVTIESGFTYEDILASINEELLNITISNEATMHHMTNAIEREKILAVKLEEANLNLKKMASKDPL